VGVGDEPIRDAKEWRKDLQLNETDGPPRMDGLRCTRTGYYIIIIKSFIKK
jgi:hypothetical protein